MDEISIGQYHDLVVYLTRLSNEKMSVDEANVLVDTGLNFNQQITTGEQHETSKGDLYYRLSGGKKDINFFSFLIMDEDGHKSNKPNKSKIILGILLGLIVVWALTNDGDTIEESYMHQLDFENKLADISKGRIVIEDSPNRTSR